MSSANEDDEGWEVIGIDMLSPPMSLRVSSNSFNSSNFFESTDDGGCWGGTTSFAVTKHSPFCCAKQVSQDEPRNEKHLCYAFGLLLKIIFDHSSSSDVDSRTNNHMGELLRSLLISRYDAHTAKLTRMPRNIKKRLHLVMW
jgi:hypothetical protein